MNIPIEWTSLLEVEDWNFIRRFVLASGSLKEVAKQYEVTYPTVRLKLDRIIQKILLSQSPQEDTYVTMIKKLVLDGDLQYNTAKILIQEYRKKTEGK